MSATTRMLRRVSRRAATRLVGKVGKRLVAGMADTSSDAPDAAFKPKRDLYAKMQAGEATATGRATDAAPAEEQEHGHSHGHGHSHDHEG